MGGIPVITIPRVSLPKVCNQLTLVLRRFVRARVVYSTCVRKLFVSLPAYHWRKNEQYYAFLPLPDALGPM